MGDQHVRQWARYVGISITLLLTAACQPEAAKESTGEASATAADLAQSAPLNPLATTQYGPVQGLMDGDIQVFKGIRYGADTAATRFAPPAPPESWTEPAPAVAYGDSSPQPARGGLSLFDSWLPDPVPATSEDCLFLNVWTPGTDDAKRPVMVWFHGGGFTTGSGSSNVYDGTRLASRGDVVVVTVNHRLNVFGYLYLDEYGEAFEGSGNAGMLDLVASLEWVRDNIANFGGDPDNVLIFGESGGGWKVSTLMAMEAAGGLFHRAVVQSGPGLELMDIEDAKVGTAALLDELGLDESNIDTIRTLPTETVVEAALAAVEKHQVGLANRPVVDGVHNLRHPFTPDAPVVSASVPLMIGSTQTEMSMLYGAARPELFELTWDTLPEAVAAAIPGADPATIIEGYRELHPDLDAPNLLFEALTDHGVFGRGSFTLADRKALQGDAPVYQYYLSWGSPVEGGKWGATHALDIGFVFDNVAKSESMSGTGEAQQALADVMSEAWLAFARSGNPNHAGLPEWPAYDTKNRATMVFDDTSAVVNDPRGRERAILDAALTSAGE